MKTFTINLGDIVQVGMHRIGCGDSCDADFVSKIFGKNKANLIVTDVPYGVAYVENSANTKHKPIANDHLQTDSEFACFTQTWLDTVKPHMKRKNAAYVFCGDKMLFAFHEGMKQAGWKFGQLLHWIKTAAVLGRLDYAPQHETLVYFWFGAHEFVKSKDKSVIIHPKPQKNILHPTSKPIPILRRFIQNSSRVGDLVYDPFAGSGTTALAAEQTKRRSISIELEPEYCQIIVQRLERLTGESAIKLSPKAYE